MVASPPAVLTGGHASTVVVGSSTSLTANFTLERGSSTVSLSPWLPPRLLTLQLQLALPLPDLAWSSADRKKVLEFSP